MASIELLERMRSGYRLPVEVYEHEQPRQPVAAEDIIRIDHLNRRVVACPKGQVPASRLELSRKERDALVPPPEPKPQGYMNPGPYGFSPEGVVMGGYILDESR